MTAVLDRLTATELATVGRCIRAIVDGPFIPDWEFSTLMGPDRDEVRAVLSRWPASTREKDTEYIAINALNNLWGYPHRQHDAVKPWTGATTEEIRGLLDKLRERAPG